MKCNQCGTEMVFYRTDGSKQSGFDYHYSCPKCYSRAKSKQVITIEGKTMTIGSWKEELNRKYDEVVSGGDLLLTDKANDIILEAIAKLDAIKYSIRP